jgi:hypothetical protein
LVLRIWSLAFRADSLINKNVGIILFRVLTAGGSQHGARLCVCGVDRRAGGYAASMKIFGGVEKSSGDKGGRAPLMPRGGVEPPRAFQHCGF